MRILDIMLTSECNLKCPFCYGPDPLDKGRLSLDAWLLVLDELVKWDIKGIVIAGGEPSLSPDLLPFVQHAADVGYWISLQTNATRPAVLRKVLPAIDVLAIPVDGVSTEVQVSMRTSSSSTSRSVRAAQLAREVNPAIGLKVGTVVTPLNVVEMPALADLVCGLIRPDLWKVYEFRARGDGFKHVQFRSKARSAYSLAKRQLETLKPNVRLEFSEASEGDRAYVIVNPDGRVIVPNGDAYRSFGYLIGTTGEFNALSITDAINYLDDGAHKKNVLKSFPAAPLAVNGRGPTKAQTASEGTYWRDREGF